MDAMPPAGAKLVHGPISCLACYPAGHSPGAVYEAEIWRVDNNPGYWGAAQPEVLVLGFSKGANQRGDMPFERIAFNNARGNLKDILVALELVDAKTDIDACFTSAETRMGFASVIRCGLGMKVEGDKYATSGKVVRSAIAPNSRARRFFDGCTERFLQHLPESVRVVVFLGLDRPYVETLFARMKELHPSIIRLSELTYQTEAVTFVHVVHPSPLATSHRQDWLREHTSSLADCRRQACRALGRPTSAQPRMSVPEPAPKPNAAPAPKVKRVIASGVGADDLIDELREAMADGRLLAEVIENKRAGSSELAKILRLRRADGEEFAVDRTASGFNVWSSVRPVDENGISATEEYQPTRTRHSNLSCMPKLRGPKNGNLGARAWKLRLDTLMSARDFILSAR